jgi:hypothetical protein
MNRFLTLLTLATLLDPSIAQPVYNVAHANFATTTSTMISQTANFVLSAVNDGFITACSDTCPESNPLT